MNADRILTVLLLVALAGCSRGEAPVGPHEVRYTLAWKAERATEVEGAKQIVNDRGYTIRLRRGYVVSRSVELVECAKTAKLTRDDVSSFFASLLQPAPAFAGHSVGTPNPAAILQGHVESLTQPQTTEAGRVVLQPMRYCRAFYLVARAEAGCVGMPSDVDMFDQSLVLEGTVRDPGGEEKQLLLRSPIANGKESALFAPGSRRDPADELVLDTGRTGAEVVVRRNLDTLFDGVDFTQADQRRIARQVLTNLIDQTEIEVIATP